MLGKEPVEVHNWLFCPSKCL